MDCYMYLSLTPEALVLSMLPPEEFGVYYSTGTEKKTHERAMFFEVDPAFRHDELRIEEGLERCVPHEDGSPKRSIYVAVYRVLERVPLNALRSLHLFTQDGRGLELQPSTDIPEDGNGLHLYQEIAPVHPLVASAYGPREFYNLIVRNPVSLLSLPAVCFAELRLDELATDPAHGAVGDLPYENIDHLRLALADLQHKRTHTKMVNRIQPAQFPFRTIKNGIFVGNEHELLYFPMPSQEELRTNHYRWWRSVNL